MGTRSLTKVIQTYETSIANEDNNNEVHKERKPITCMYRQYDGYMSGHGAELAEWLSQYTVVNGIKMDHDRDKIFNGMDCLAAQMFAHFKEEAGNIYCMHPDSENCGEEYNYEIEKKNKQIIITIHGVYSNKQLFHGDPAKLLEKIKIEL